MPNEETVFDGTEDDEEDHDDENARRQLNLNALSMCLRQTVCYLAD